MIVELILFFLAVSLLFYVLFGGADFGGGILELFLGKESRKEQQELITHAMAPIWEANHVWLVLVVVILFMGFPKVYTEVSIYLHLPLVALLMGIVVRGCAFTFRYYDTLGTQYHPTYSKFFALSSVWSAYFLGSLGGALQRGNLNPQATDYYSLFIAPWLNIFCASMGVFTVALFAFLAAVFLLGEAETPDMLRIFRKKAIAMNGVLLIAGLVVFAAAEYSGMGLVSRFFENHVSAACFAIAACLWIPFWMQLRNAVVGKAWVLRALAAAIATLVLVGWLAIQYPVALLYTDHALTFHETAAPLATMKVLLGALVVGVSVILPALGYLFSVFKWSALPEQK